MRSRWQQLALAALLALAAPAVAHAQAIGVGPVDSLRQGESWDPVLEARVSALAAELRCPVCQGLSIEDSPTDLAREMRGVVREQLAAGRSEEQVRAYFVDKYGEWILLQPEPSGFNLLVYVLPWLAVLAGAAVIALLVRRWMRAPAAPDAAPYSEYFENDRADDVSRVEY